MHALLVSTSDVRKSQSVRFASVSLLSLGVSQAPSRCLCVCTEMTCPKALVSSTRTKSVSSHYLENKFLPSLTKVGKNMSIGYVV